MRLTPSILLGLVAGVGLAACSRTAPESQWPPPGPAGGLPYIPFPEDSIFESSDEGDIGDGPAKPTSAKPRPIDAALPSSPPTKLERSASCDKKQ
jgi:hypothetical protein